MAKRAEKTEHYCAIAVETSCHKRRLSTTEEGAISSAKWLINNDRGSDYYVVKILKRVKRNYAISVEVASSDDLFSEDADYPTKHESKTFELYYEQIYHNSDEVHRARFIAYRKTGEWPQW